MPAIMNRARLRWGAWFSDRHLTLELPDTWQVRTFRPEGGEPLSDRELEKAVESPIASKPLAELARGKKSVLIVIDDLTRPTPAHSILPLVIGQLARGGVGKEKIRILIGVGAHHPLLGPGIRKKIGKEMTSAFMVANHNPFVGCDYIGRTRIGTPVLINREFLRADLKICLGSILPHAGAGFSGGAKLVFPGVAGIESIHHNHREGSGFKGGTGLIEGNMFRADFEEAAALAGLDFIVNAVLDSERRILGLFCGDFVAAHRRGVQLARRVYNTQVPQEYDAVILSAYPLDTEFYQCRFVSRSILESPSQPLLHGKGTVVIGSAASEGMGENFLCAPGFGMADEVVALNRKNTAGYLFYSENVSQPDLERWGFPGAALCGTWTEIVERIRERHGPRPRVAVFPCAGMQFSFTGDGG